MLLTVLLPGFILLLVLLLAYAMVTELIVFILTRVPFVPTSKADLEDMIVKVGIQPVDYVYDIGSGNGKVIFAIEDLVGARVKGLQRAGWTQTYARLKARLIGSKAEFVSGNFFDHPWRDATVIYAYLYPFLMNQVGEKILEDCKPGTKVVVRDFPIPNLTLTDWWETPSNHKIYLYQI